MEEIKKEAQQETKDEVKKESTEGIKSEEKKEATVEPKAEKPAEEKVAKKEQKPSRVEISKNCAECKKPVKKIRYYRNMNFFCNKKCWLSFKKKTDAKKDQQAEVQKPA